MFLQIGIRKYLLDGSPLLLPVMWVLGQVFWIL